LINEKYIGTYVFNKASSADADGRRNSHKYKDDDEIIRIEDAVPQIIGKDIFAAMQEKMQSRKKEFIGHKSIETYLLTSKIICGKCGSTYCGQRRREGRNSNLIVRYGCNKRQRQGKSSCDNKDIRREYIEALVLDELAKNVFDEKLLPLIYSQFAEYNETSNSENNRIIQTVQSQIKAVDKKIDSVVNLLMQTSSKVLFEKLDALENEKSALEQKLYELKASDNNSAMSYGEIIALFNGAKEMFKDGTLESMKRLISLFVEFVVIHEDSVEIKFSFSRNNPFDPEELDYDNSVNENRTERKPDKIGLSDTVSKNTYWRGGGGTSPYISTNIKAVVCLYCIYLSSVGLS
jgi:site-specific DNA recombinase